MTSSFLFPFSLFSDIPYPISPLHSIYTFKRSASSTSSFSNPRKITPPSSSNGTCFWMQPSFSISLLTAEFVLHTSPPSFLLESLLVEPRPEDGQRGRVLCLDLGPLHRPVLVPQRVRRYHDRQLQLDGLLQVARGHNELK
jgi:hypothetical protein